MCSWFYKMLHFLSTITRDKGYKKIISERILCIHLTASYVVQHHNCQLCLCAFFVCLCAFSFQGASPQSQEAKELCIYCNLQKFWSWKISSCCFTMIYFQKIKWQNVNFQTSLNLQHSIPKIHVNCLAPSQSFNSPPTQL